jgi:hypothetical protein
MTKGQREESTNAAGKGRIKFRYMDSERACDFTVDNVTSEGVTEGLRHIANALAGRNITAAPAPRLPRRIAGSTEVLDEKDVKETPDTDVLPFPEETPAEPEQEGTDAAEAAAAKAKRKVKRPNVLDDPKLTGAKVSLADFMKEKGNPVEMLDKDSVVAVWYKQEFNITEMTIDRIYTAFKHAAWDSQLPTDVEKPLKNLTYQRKWFGKTKNPGAFEINWVGEDAVNKMGAATKSASA